MTDTQMFLDHGPESFLGEVTGLVQIRKLHIDIVPTMSGHGDRVLVEFEALIPEHGLHSSFTATASGRSYGEALRKVREQLRLELGR